MSKCEHEKQISYNRQKLTIMNEQPKHLHLLIFCLHDLYENITKSHGWFSNI